MSELAQIIQQILLVIIDLMTLGLLAGIFYVIGVAIYTMARNQTPKWLNIGYILVILLAALLLLRWYPAQVIGSIRTSLQEARPEAEQLRGELENWLPGRGLGDGDTGGVVFMTTTPTPTVPATPTATPVPGTTPVSALDIAPTPLATATPRPTETPVPTPTRCVIQFRPLNDPTQLLWMDCPPTPEVWQP